MIREIPLSEFIPRILPDGWQIKQPRGDGFMYTHRSQLGVIVDTADHEDGRDWMHISVSRPDRLPSWDDLKFVKEVFARDRYAYQVLPPPERYINIHPFALHMRVPLTGNPFPDFTRGGNTL